MSPPLHHRFSNHQKPLAILREKVRGVFNGKAKELKKAGATRMGSHTFVGERLEELKSSLQATVVDERYTAENYLDMSDEREIGNAGTVLREHKGGTAKKLVLDDAGFWQRVRRHVGLTMPICKLLRRRDSSAPSVGKVYHGWFEVGESIKSSVEVPYAQAAKDKYDQRWIYAHCAFFAAAYVLDPEFVDHEQSSLEEVMTGFGEVLGKIGMLMKVRLLQGEKGEYTELWKKRRAAIGKDLTTQLKDFPAYPTAETDEEVREFCAKACAQLAQYRGKKGSFAWPWAFGEGAKNTPAYMWWDTHGSTTPELQTVARMVLAQPASASICERINSEFAFVKDRRRNSLAHSKANKLVGLFHNLRLLKRMRQVTYAEPAIAWTDDLEQSSVTKFEPAAIGSTSALVPRL